MKHPSSESGLKHFTLGAVVALALVIVTPAGARYVAQIDPSQYSSMMQMMHPAADSGTSSQMAQDFQKYQTGTAADQQKLFQQYSTMPGFSMTTTQTSPSTGGQIPQGALPVCGLGVATPCLIQSGSTTGSTVPSTSAPTTPQTNFSQMSADQMKQMYDSMMKNTGTHDQSVAPSTTPATSPQTNISGEVKVKVTQEDQASSADPGVQFQNAYKTFLKRTSKKSSASAVGKQAIEFLKYTKRFIQDHFLSCDDVDLDMSAKRIQSKNASTKNILKEVKSFYLNTLDCYTQAEADAEE